MTAGLKSYLNGLTQDIDKWESNLRFDFETQKMWFQFEVAVRKTASHISIPHFLESGDKIAESMHHLCSVQLVIHEPSGMSVLNNSWPEDP